MNLTARMLTLKTLTVLNLTTACDHASSDKSEPKGPLNQPSLKMYESCEDLQKDVRTVLDDMKNRRGNDKVSASAEPPESADGGGSDGNNSQTNLQERGVDEADSFKLGKNNLYTVVGSRIEVVDHSSLTRLGDLDLKGTINIQLYTGNDRLIAVGQKQVIDWGSQTTEVRVYDESASGLPALITTQTFQGVVRDTRRIGQHLFLVLNDSLDVEDRAEPVILDKGEKVRGIACNSIVKKIARDNNFGLTRIVSLDVTSPDLADKSISFLGGTDQVYMSQDGLYVGQALYEYDSYTLKTEQLILTRILFDKDTGEIAPVAIGAVSGRVKDQWAFKEYADQGVLAVTTSTGYLWDDGDNVAQNHLWILKTNRKTQKLEAAAAIKNFGTGEDIRAVRYVGKMAYVVTFKKTDPLFAFDLTDALSPKLLGELKIPGFSVYMHPAPGDRMIGVGFDALDQGGFALYQGIQISLFDVKDPANLKRLDNHVIGVRGSSSEVTGDHHAFFFDAESKLMAVPVVELTNDETPDEAPEDQGRLGWPSPRRAFSGVIFYDVEDKLTEKARVSHFDLLPDACKNSLNFSSWWQDRRMSPDVNRVFKIDNRLLSVSRFGVREHSQEDPGAVVKSLGYEASTGVCDEFIPIRD